MTTFFFKHDTLFKTRTSGWLVTHQGVREDLATYQQLEIIIIGTVLTNFILINLSVYAHQSIIYCLLVLYVENQKSSRVMVNVENFKCMCLKF